jgi:hypothetical protein
MHQGIGTDYGNEECTNREHITHLSKPVRSLLKKKHSDAAMMTSAATPMLNAIVPVVLSFEISTSAGSLNASTAYTKERLNSAKVTTTMREVTKMLWLLNLQTRIAKQIFTIVPTKLPTVTCTIKVQTIFELNRTRRSPKLLQLWWLTFRSSPGKKGIRNGVEVQGMPNEDLIR